MSLRLLQPPAPPDSVSGGYRFNREIVRRLVATGMGKGVDVAPEDLELAGPDPGADEAVVLDSLYFGIAPPRWVVEHPRSLLLVHYLPSQNPLLDAEERGRWAERERRWIAAVGGILTTSSRLAEDLRAEIDLPIQVATPGIDGCFRPRSSEEIDEEGGPLVVAVGTLRPEKGQVAIVRALLGWRGSDGRAARCLLVGDEEVRPDYRDAICKEADGLDLELAGGLPVEGVASSLRRAALFVSGSTFESYGMAVAEAVASGVPVVAYRAGEVDRWVRDGVNGFLVEPGDVTRFEARIHQLLDDPEERERLSGGAEGLFFPSWEYTFHRVLHAARREEEDDGAPSRIERYSGCRLPTRLGTFEVQVYRYGDEEEAVLISRGDLDRDVPFVRVHSECFTGEILHSLKCDCRYQLEAALEEVARRGTGAVVYLRQEGRGIGLGNKIRAYAEQEKGANTVEANEILGFPADLRDFRVAAAILKDNGVHRVVLNTNNPDKVSSLRANGIEVDRVVPSTSAPNPHNLDYLRTKARLLRHLGLEQSLTSLGQGPRVGNGAAAGEHAPCANAQETLLVFDVDGVLDLGSKIPQEAIELIARLRAVGYSLRFLTNDGINSRRSRLLELASLGLTLDPSELYTASYLTARFVAERATGPILPLFGEPALEEFAGLPTGVEDVAAVVVGDWFGHYDDALLRAAYRALRRGAELVAMHKKPCWPADGEPEIDIGFWVAGLEYCAGRPATVVGKPSGYSYGTVLEDAGFPPERSLMIADEEEPDLLGAREAGLHTLCFRPGVPEEATESDGNLRSYADLWQLLDPARVGARS